MSVIQKYRERVKKYGRKFVWTMILRNKIYRPVDKEVTRIMSIFLRKHRLANVIIIESHNDFDSNGGTFYSYLIKNGLNREYKIVWLIKNSKPRKLPSNVYCYNIFKPSIKKSYFLCRAKIMTADDIITPKVRTDQKSFFLRHGAGGLKNVKGKAVVIPDSLDYILGMSEKYAPIETDQLMLKYPDKRFIYLGFPSHDLLFQDNSDELLKITDMEFRKVILWMPTFRRGGGVDREDSCITYPLGIPLFHDQNEYKDINQFLADYNILLVIKIHPMQDLSDLKAIEMTNITILTGNDVKKKNIDNYRLMSCCDAMISDYSGAAYEFLQLDRPIAYVLDHSYIDLPRRLQVNDIHITGCVSDDISID